LLYAPFHKSSVSYIIVWAAVQLKKHSTGYHWGQVNANSKKKGALKHIQQPENKSGNLLPKRGKES
jgi:hypothetical protein